MGLKPNIGRTLGLLPIRNKPKPQKRRRKERHKKRICPGCKQRLGPWCLRYPTCEQAEQTFSLEHPISNVSGVETVVGNFQVIPAKLSTRKNKRSRRTLFYRKYSAIDRDGVFAKVSISSGRWIGEYTGDVISRQEMINRSHECEELGIMDTYLYEIGRGLFVDARWNGNIFRYLNHSCAPNVKAEVMNGRVMICSIMNIRKDEELTVDYGMEEKEDGKKVVCRCGARECRKYI